MSMTVTEAKVKMQRAGFLGVDKMSSPLNGSHSNTASQLPTSSWLDGPVVDRSGIERVEREHTQRIAKMKADADARIERSRQHKRDLIAQSRRHKELLREQSMERRRQEDRVELAQRRDHRTFMEAIGAGLSEIDARQLADEIEEQNVDPNDPEVVRMRTWLENEWTEAGVDIRVCVDPLIRNGAASRAGGYIEIPPIQSLITAIIVAHELGHLLHPKIENERVVDGGYGRKISPASEIAAWRWNVDRTPVWSEKMHGFMVRCLDSYRPHADDAEKAAMDQLCSHFNFLQVRLRIAMGE